MHVKENKAILVGSQVLEHPAIKAWSRLSKSSNIPSEIVVWQNIRLGHDYGTSTPTPVCLIPRVGISNENVIAKRVSRHSASGECEVYDRILPKMPYRSLHFYGAVEDADAEYCWLFVEYAGDEKYLPSMRKHRVAAGRWLGIMHTSSKPDDSSQLQEIEIHRFLNMLRSARNTIQKNLSNTWLNSKDVNLLTIILHQCNSLEEEWTRIEEFCDRLPKTLVHGDFYKANIRVQSTTNRLIVLPFDWERCGWGIPAVDFNPDTRPDTYAYYLTIRRHWPNIDKQTVKRLSNVGLIIHLSRCLEADSKSLEQPWVDKCMQNMGYYKACFNKVLSQLSKNEVL